MSSADPDTTVDVDTEVSEPENEPPATMVAYVAVLFISWVVFWMASPRAPGQQIWVQVAQQLPGFVIALLLAEALYRRSRFAWTIGLVLGAAAIALGVLNAGGGGNFAGVFTGGQIASGTLEILLLLLPPTQRWIRGVPAR